MSHKPLPPQVDVIVRFSALTYGGDVIGEIVEGPERLCRKKVFVPFVAPGEEGLVQIPDDDARFVHGVLKEITRRSPDRVIPPCPLFTRCGGCDLQHLSIAAQRHEKRRMVEETLRIKGGINPVHGVSLIGEDLPGIRYRTRASLHLALDGTLGFYRRGTGEVVDVEQCLLMHPSLEALFSRIRPFAANLAPEVGSIDLELIEHGDAAVFRLRERGDVERALRAPELRSLFAALPLFKFTRNGEPLYEQAEPNSENPGTVAPSTAGHFSQVNSFANELLRESVLSLVDPGPVTELYAGAGNITFPLAEAGHKVRAVEVNPVLIAAAQERARRASAGQAIEFFTMSSERFIRHHLPDPTIVLDPPRGGAREVARRISAESVHKIVYVSCNLPTLTRDLSELTGRGFTASRVLVLDMFPQTHHVETITELIPAGA